jgi:hypothetical protein
MRPGGQVHGEVATDRDALTRIEPNDLVTHERLGTLALRCRPPRPLPEALLLLMLMLMKPADETC